MNSGDPSLELGMTLDLDLEGGKKRRFVEKS